MCILEQVPVTVFLHTQFESPSSVNCDSLNRLLQTGDFLNKQFTTSTLRLQ